MKRVEYRVSIRFSVDLATLDACIRYMLKFCPELKITKRNIINTIKKEVYSKGHSIVDFPELWGDDVWGNVSNDECVEKWVGRMKTKFGL